MEGNTINEDSIFWKFSQFYLKSLLINDERINEILTNYKRGEFQNEAHLLNKAKTLFWIEMCKYNLKKSLTKPEIIQQFEKFAHQALFEGDQSALWEMLKIRIIYDGSVDLREFKKSTLEINKELLVELQKKIQKEIKEEYFKHSLSNQMFQ